MSDQDVWSLAQVALAHGLDPIIGECTWINGSFFPQIRGLRRKGRDQLIDIYGERGRPDFKYSQLVDSTKREELEIPEGALAFMCEGMIPAKRQAHSEDAIRYADAGAPWDDIKNMIGDPPLTIGYGYLTEEQMEAKDNPRWYHKCSDKTFNVTERFVKGGGGKKWMARELRGDKPCPTCDKESYAEPSAYPHVQHAQKRAEAHWWKKECDLPFDIGPGGEGLADFDDWDIEVIEPSKLIEGKLSAPTFMGHDIPDNLNTPEKFESWRNGILELEARKIEIEDQPEEVTRARGAKAKDDLYTPPSESLDRANPDFWPKAILETIVEKEYAQDLDHAAGMLSYSAFDKNVAKTPALTYAKAYTAAKDDGKTSKEAGEIGMAAYLNGLKRRREKDK